MFWIISPSPSYKIVLWIRPCRTGSLVGSVLRRGTFADLRDTRRIGSRRIFFPPHRLQTALTAFHQPPLLARIPAAVRSVLLRVRRIRTEKQSADDNRGHGEHVQRGERLVEVRRLAHAPGDDHCVNIKTSRQSRTRVCAVKRIIDHCTKWAYNPRASGTFETYLRVTYAQRSWRTKRTRRPDTRPGIPLASGNVFSCNFFVGSRAASRNSLSWLSPRTPYLKNAKRPLCVKPANALCHAIFFEFFFLINFRMRNPLVFYSRGPTLTYRVLDVQGPADNERDQFADGHITVNVCGSSVGYSAGEFGVTHT